MAWGYNLPGVRRFIAGDLSQPVEAFFLSRALSAGVRKSTPMLKNLTHSAYLSLQGAMSEEQMQITYLVRSS